MVKEIYFPRYSVDVVLCARSNHNEYYDNNIIIVNQNYTFY